MTSTTTRRGAIATMAAAATVAVTPAIALTPDPVFALADGCKSLLAEYVEACSISSLLHREISEETDRLLGTVQQAAASGDSGYQKYCKRHRDEFDRLSKANGYGKAWDAGNRISRHLRKSVDQLTGTHATTIRGVMAKLEVMSAVDRECEEPAIYERHDEWLAIVRTDLEHIAGGVS